METYKNDRTQIHIEVGHLLLAPLS